MDNIKLLRKLGMTEYEARAYISLAKLGPSTVKEVVAESKLPRNKAYEALQRLEEKNKAVSLPVSPRKYKILNPEMLRDEVKDLNSSVNALIKLVEQPKLTEYKDMFWILKGKKAVHAKLSEQTLKVEKEILSCNNLSKVLHNNIRTLKQAADRGVKVKMICTFDKSKIISYKAWMKTGAKIRVFDKEKFGPLLPRITVFDNNVSRLTIGRPEIKKDEDYMTLITESKAFAQMLKNHFMNMWNNSKPIEKYI